MEIKKRLSSLKIPFKVPISIFDAPISYYRIIATTGRSKLIYGSLKTRE